MSIKFLFPASRCIGIHMMRSQGESHNGRSLNDCSIRVVKNRSVQRVRHSRCSWYQVAIVHVNVGRPTTEKHLPNEFPNPPKNPLPIPSMPPITPQPMPVPATMVMSDADAHAPIVIVIQFPNTKTKTKKN